jgi:hypothetical protein
VHGAASHSMGTFESKITSRVRQQRDFDEKASCLKRLTSSASAAGRSLYPAVIAKDSSTVWYECCQSW